MPELPPILISALTGFLSGLVLSIPVGPVNLTIMNEGARQGFRHAALISAGALTMELIYCSIAFTGFASFFSRGEVKAAMEVFSFAFMVFLGIKFLMVQSVPTASKMEERIEGKFHPTSAYMTGFVRVMGNLGVLAFWIVLAANFISREWVRPSLESKGACVLGVMAGTGLWFFGLSYAVSVRRKKFSEKTLLRMQRGSGLSLLLLGLGHGCQIVWQMHRASRF
jgi:L-lysine exporter family protein LysE/ArgO